MAITTIRDIKERRERIAAEKQASEICKNCRWWRIRMDGMKFGGNEKSPCQDAGACQVNPPVAAGWPQTLETDKCSRFERRAEPAAPPSKHEEFAAYDESEGM